MELSIASAANRRRWHMDNLERRAFAECRAEASDNGKKIRGYAIVFHSQSVDLGGFREIIAPEAVDRTLSEGLDVRALVDHDSAKVIGRTRAGTLQLRKDSRGLRIEVEPDDEISYARDILRSVARGDVTGMSFGFRAIGDEWNYDEKTPVRTVTDMRVSEVSIVTFPAYQATDVQIAQRSLRAFQAQNPLQNRIAWLEKWHKTKLAR
jgi:HK97 family phage prohead protease